jgi:glycerophosphoryl diester phosphodiesterase
LENNIWEMDYASLDGIDVGSWFAPEFKGEPIPTLESVIDTVRDKMKLNIELKMNGHEKRLVERVVEIVEEKNFTAQCIVTSFDFESIDSAKKLNKDIKVGYIFSKMPEDIDVFTANVDVLSVNYKLINKDFITKAHANNKEVHVYTVNEPDEMKRLIHLGVDSIITDRPDILVEVLRSL